MAEYHWLILIPSFHRARCPGPKSPPPIARFRVATTSFTALEKLLCYCPNLVTVQTYTDFFVHESPRILVVGSRVDDSDGHSEDK